MAVPSQDEERSQAFNTPETAAVVARHEKVAPFPFRDRAPASGKP